MTENRFSRLLEPDTLTELLGTPGLLLWDLGSEASYREGHVPGANHVPPAAIIDGRPPAPGRLPEAARLETLFGALGLAADRHVVVYDDEGGGWAGRMIWTLEIVGHRHWSYLNGGIHAWRAGGQALQREIAFAKPTVFEASFDFRARARLEDISARLGDDDFVPWDARSAAEYSGQSVRAARGGHIPGARHCEWTSLMDPQRQLRLQELPDIAARLRELGLVPEAEIVTYCHTHHRSGLTWLAARLLNYPRIRAYDGSWSEWGNSSDTPVEGCSNE